MNYQLFSMYELISETQYYHLTLNKQINAKELELIITKIKNEKLKSIVIEINEFQTNDMFENLIKKISSDVMITKIKLNSFEISKNDVITMLNSLTKYYVLSKINQNKNLIEIKLINFEINDNILLHNENIVNNLKLSYKNLSEEDISSLVQLIESLNFDIDKLQRERNEYEKSYKNLEKRISEGVFDSQNIKYNNLMEKYKDTLKRLENLRNSRLGKLQIKYWDLKG